MQEAERTQALLQSQLTSVKEQYETMFWETVDLEDMIAMDEREIEALSSSSLLLFRFVPWQRKCSESYSLRR
jgi:hypothetical protein